MLADAFDKANPSEPSVRQNARAMARLLREANKIKHVLSANAAASASIESLANDIDLRTSIDREAFEARMRSDGLIQRFGQPIDELLTRVDIVDVIDQEAEEDLLGLARTGERDIYASPLRTARRRQSWLLITLVNTILASIVISRFEGAIEKIVALAVLMPIVAAMGGNAGMQVITVMVRALAARDLAAGGTWRVVGKEVVVGVLNGVVFATIMGTIATLWFGDPSLGLVLASAMMFNMVWAGLAGTLIPLTLERFRIDPAVAARASLRPSITRTWPGGQVSTATRCGWSALRNTVIGFRSSRAGI